MLMGYERAAKRYQAVFRAPIWRYLQGPIDKTNDSANNYVAKIHY